MTNEMINTVKDRADLMMTDVQVQEIMMTFDNPKDAQEWLIKAAVATLMGAQFE